MGIDKTSRPIDNCCMTFDDLKEHFRGVTKAAKELGVSRETLYRWRDSGIPYVRQLQIESQMRGKLKASSPPWEQRA